MQNQNIKRIDKEERTYFIPEANIEYPSVTTVIGQISTKTNPLMNWAVKTTIEYLQNHQPELVQDPIETFKKAKLWHKELQQEALDLGSALHNAIEVYLRGQKIDGLLETTPALKKPFAEFIKWQTTNNFELIETEHIVWSEMQFAGTLDIVARLNGKIYVIDLKTSKSIYDEFLMQIASYRYAYEERSKTDVEGVGILRLPKFEGDDYEWREYTLEQASEAFDCFMHLCAYWWEQKRRKK